VKLTLRTLLAYLDDTLDAGDIKTIGDKVAENDNAQNLIERIKQVTRRRRLTTPPDTGPGAFDPNDVAEYLDNALPSERIGEIEKQCLESDVHLAEVATCHQVLTLVLGEPAIVPPQAKERMYKLVSGKESLPYKKAAPARVASGGVGVGETDEEELGSGDNWLRWVLPAAGILLVLVLGLTVWQLTRVPSARHSIVKNNEGDKDGGEKKDEGKKDEGKKDEGKKDEGKKDEGKKDEGKKEGGRKEGGRKDEGKKDEGKKDEGKKDEGKKEGGKKDEGKNGGSDVGRPAPPSKERAAVATFRGGIAADVPTGLAQRRAEGWEGINPGGRVFSAEPLVALPGLISIVETERKAVLTLRGNVPALALADLMQQLLESSVVLHKSDDFDVDVTLKRGRLYIRNNKPKDDGDKNRELKARLRFEGEVWDITLPRKGDEIGIDLIKIYTPDIEYANGEKPRALAFLFMVQGDAHVKVDAYHTHHLETDPPKTMMMSWDSFRKTSPPVRLPKGPPAWEKGYPAPEQLTAERRGDFRKTTAGLQALAGRLKGEGPKAADPKKALREMLGEEDNVSRVLGIYGFGALDDVDYLVSLLGKDELDLSVVRAQSVFVLRHWLANDAGNIKRLYDAKEDSGVLRKREYKSGEAKLFVELLFDFKPRDRYSPELFTRLAGLLAHQKTAIAQLAFQHLWEKSNGKLPPGFNAADSKENRQRYSRTIQGLIDDGKLPPRPSEKPAG
jgi:hypothetical protein